MRRLKLAFPFVLASALLAVGCDRAADPAPAAFSTNEAAAAINKTFAGADTANREAAQQLSQALSSDNYSEAFSKVTLLGGSPELTPEQRQVIARSQLTVMERMRAAAAAGDKQAQALLEMHRASK
jgi:hypothetical protein